MLFLEEYTYNRSKETFEACGMLKEVIKENPWQRLLEIHNTKHIDSFIISHEVFPEEFYRGLRKGTLLVRFGVGYDSVPIDICREQGILVANTPGTLEQSVAEYAMMMMLSIARRFDKHRVAMKQDTWNPLMAQELEGKKLAIIGFGSIGRSLAKIAKHGFNMHIIAFDGNTALRDSYPDLFDTFTTDFADAVADADYISLHLNLSDSTSKFINHERLSCMNKKAVLINTSRGGIIDEDQLYLFLKDQKIHSAGLDVFVHEPYVPSGTYDLRDLDNLIMMPHIASHTVEANRRMALSAIRSIELYKSGDLKQIPIVPQLKDLVQG